MNIKSQIVNILILSFFVSFLFTQKLITNQNEFDRLRSEYYSLLENKVKEELLKREILQSMLVNQGI